MSLKPLFRQVAVLCPERVTGGPEALHQLAFTINRLGGKAYMIYVWGDGKENPCLQAYAHYDPQQCQPWEIDDAEDVCVVYPEVMTQRVMEDRNKKWLRALWWLSVDVAFDCNSNLLHPEGLRRLFTQDVLHLTQSHYASRFVQEQKARWQYPLFDYIGDIPARLEAPQEQVAVYRHQQAAAARVYMARTPDTKYFCIGGMSRSEVLYGLRRSYVYLDFGSSTGRDRIPREAAACGCVVFLHRGGANAGIDDHPLPGWYVFDDADTVSGLLQSKVAHVKDNYTQCYEEQSQYRERISKELFVFEHQVRRLFFI